MLEACRGKKMKAAGQVTLAYHAEYLSLSLMQCFSFFWLLAPSSAQKHSLTHSPTNSYTCSPNKYSSIECRLHTMIGSCHDSPECPNGRWSMVRGCWPFDWCVEEKKDCTVVYYLLMLHGCEKNELNGMCVVWSGFMGQLYTLPHLIMRCVNLQRAHARGDRMALCMSFFLAFLGDVG